MHHLQVYIVTPAFHLRHTWFLAIFVFCGIVVLANVIHYILFRVLRRKEEKKIGTGWNVHYGVMAGEVAVACDESLAGASGWSAACPRSGSDSL